MNWEQLERDALEPVLYEIYRKNDYTLTNLFGEGAFLRWGDASVSKPEIFDELFPLADTFIMTNNSPPPVVSYLKNRFIAKKGKYGWHQHRETYRQLVAEYREGACIPPRYFPELTAWRDALEKQLHRHGKQLKEPLREARSVLMVWYVEAERSLIETDGEDVSGEETERRLGALANMQATFKRIWNKFRHGAHLNNFVENDFHSIPRKEDGVLVAEVPAELTRAQKLGVRHCLEKREAVLQKAVSAHRKWWALEVLLQKALLRQPVKSSEEVTERLEAESLPYDDETLQTSSFAPFSAHAKWHRWGRFIVNRVWELDHEGVTMKAEQAKHISDRLASERAEELKRFDVEPADFGSKQLARVMKYHNDIGFDVS